MTTFAGHAPSVREDALATIAADGIAAAHRATGLPKSTLSRWAHDAGVTVPVDATRTARATAASLAAREHVDPDASRTCAKCSTEHPLTAFVVRRSGRLSTACQDCRRTTAKGTGAHRADHYARRLGTTPEAFAALCAEQDGRCAGCGRADPRGLVQDHDHTTGVLRAALCHPCNLTLGIVRDDPAVLRALATYLEAHGAQD